MNVVYRKRKRDRIGPCNLCGTIGPLTWDHVPPKGGIELQTVEIERVMAAFLSAYSLEKAEISQNGLKYRTLCATCNNDVLGRKYDPHLNDFVSTVARFVRTELAVPRIIHVETQPNAVVRAVLGHLLSSRLSADAQGIDPMTKDLLLSEDSEIPERINVFYWIHPFAQQIVLRGVVMPKVRGRFDEFMVVHGLLKYFPVGFLVTDAESYEDLPALTSWRAETSSFLVEVPIDLSQARGAYWPEAPEEGNVVLGGRDLSESVRARPRPRR